MRYFVSDIAYYGIETDLELLGMVACYHVDHGNNFCGDDCCTFPVWHFSVQQLDYSFSFSAGVLPQFLIIMVSAICVNIDILLLRKPFTLILIYIVFLFHHVRLTTTNTNFHLLDTLALFFIFPSMLI